MEGEAQAFFLSDQILVLNEVHCSGSNRSTGFIAYSFIAHSLPYSVPQATQILPQVDSLSCRLVNSAETCCRSLAKQRDFLYKIFCFLFPKF
jgi:hypothetical protein